MKILEIIETLLPSLELGEEKVEIARRFALKNLICSQYFFWHDSEILFLVCCYEQKKENNNNTETFVPTEIVFMVIVKRRS